MILQRGTGARLESLQGAVPPLLHHLTVQPANVDALELGQLRQHLHKNAER